MLCFANCRSPWCQCFFCCVFRINRGIAMGICLSQSDSGYFLRGSSILPKAVRPRQHITESYDPWVAKMPFYDEREVKCIESKRIPFPNNTSLNSSQTHTIFVGDCNLGYYWPSVHASRHASRVDRISFNEVIEHGRADQ